MSIVTTFFACLLAAAIVMVVAFLISEKISRVSFVDAMWGITFIVIAITSLVINTVSSGAAIVMALLVVVWGLRLASHLLPRVLQSKADDRRYVELISKWRTSNKSLSIFFRIFLVQAVLATIVMMPVIVTASAGDGVALTPFAYIGIIMWLIGFVIESMADWQLRKFVQKNNGELMTTGLWRYSRHPNYFGEITQWIGIGLIGLSAPYGLIGLVGPLLIGYLITRVSGVPLAEKNMHKRKGWQDYVRRTSVLIPLPPRS